MVVVARVSLTAIPMIRLATAVAVAAIALGLRIVIRPILLAMVGVAAAVILAARTATAVVTPIRAGMAAAGADLGDIENHAGGDFPARFVCRLSENPRGVDVTRLWRPDAWREPDRSCQFVRKVRNGWKADVRILT